MLAARNEHNRKVILVDYWSSPDIGQCQPTLPFPHHGEKCTSNPTVTSGGFVFPSYKQSRFPRQLGYLWHRENAKHSVQLSCTITCKGRECCVLQTFEQHIRLKQNALPPYICLFLYYKYSKVRWRTFEFTFTYL